MYKDKVFCFIQAKNNIATSNNVVSDRNSSFEVYNIWLNETIIVEKNNLSDNQIEYSANFSIDGTYYYLYGIMKEEEFTQIISELKF